MLAQKADQAVKEGAAGALHRKETQTPIPWQVAKSKIKEYTTSKWKRKWITAPQYKHTKLFYNSPNKNKFIQHPPIHSFMTYDTQYNNREIEYIDHNYSSDASSQ